MKFRKSAYLFIIVGVILTLVRCAHPVAPTGGLKDEDPPVVVGSQPANYSTNFDRKNITITFDEFVKLDKLQQQLLISPPTDKLPEIKLRGKSLIIKFLEDLRPETTYSVYFGDAVVDLSESNPIPGFTFVFSTGSILDSMTLTGQVRTAFDLKPAEETFVMLYVDDNDTIPVDSLPYRIRPYYITRTNKLGFYRFQNLRNEQYKMFALTDMNSNFIFDMPGEAIAYADSMIKPEFIKPTVIDTLVKQDSLLQQTVDSLSEILDEEKIKINRDSLIQMTDNSRFLYLFNEIDSTQKLLRAELTKAGLITFAFRYPARDISVESMLPLPDTFQLLKYYSKNADSLYWYFSQHVLDSLTIHVTRDTLINDTISLSLIPRAKPVKRGSKKDVVSDALQFTSTVKNKKLDLNKPLILNFAEPVVNYQMRDTNRFISNKDTLYNQLTFTKIDSIGLHYRVNETFEAGGSYDIAVPDSVFFGFSGKKNDTILISFKVPTLEDYGKLIVELQIDSAEKLIVQLLNAKELVLEEKKVNNSGKVIFSNLTPGKYKIKAIQDRNGNGRWDTGNYLRKIQPEKVSYFMKELDIRANWDFEEDWDLRGKFND
ncbi:MAG: DUF2141 domain-containing protein [Bacteroidales bacterium]|nr:DUF2141 domain-containing protein [Bacteroidales bacterium]